MSPTQESAHDQASYFANLMIGAAGGSTGPFERYHRKNQPIPGDLTIVSSHSTTVAELDENGDDEILFSDSENEGLPGSGDEDVLEGSAASREGQPLPETPGEGLGARRAAAKGLTWKLVTRRGKRCFDVSRHDLTSEKDHYVIDDTKMAPFETRVTCAVEGCDWKVDVTGLKGFVEGKTHNVRCQRGAADPSLKFQTKNTTGRWKTVFQCSNWSQGGPHEVEPGSDAPEASA